MQIRLIRRNLYRPRTQRLHQGDCGNFQVPRGRRSIVVDVSMPDPNGCRKQVASPPFNTFLRLFRFPEKHSATSPFYYKEERLAGVPMGSCLFAWCNLTDMRLQSAKTLKGKSTRRRCLDRHGGEQDAPAGS